MLEIRRDPHRAARRLRGDQRCGAGATRARTADHEQGAIGHENADAALVLLGGEVGETQREVGCKPTGFARTQPRVGDVDALRQRRMPYRARGGSGLGASSADPIEQPVVAQTDTHALGLRVRRTSHDRHARAVAPAGQQGGVFGADDGPAVTPIGDTQAHAQRTVRQQGVSHHPGDALRAEDEVHAERTTARCDVGEHRVQLGMLAQQRRELVDHDDQARQADSRVGDVPCADRRQCALAHPDLRTQTLKGPLRTVTVEIGDHPRHVGDPSERVERGSALEVRQQEDDLFRGVARTQRQHPRHQQLALAGSGHARHDGVRTVVDEVDRHDDAGRRGEPGGERASIARGLRGEKVAERHDRLLVVAAHPSRPRGEDRCRRGALAGIEHLRRDVATRDAVVDDRTRR